MKAKELADKLELEIIYFNGEDRQVSSCYIGDLLSWVMGKAKADSVWVTIMSNVNVAAVATLTDMSAVIFAESVDPDKELIDKMAKSDALFCKSPLSAYELACKINEVLN